MLPRLLDWRRVTYGTAGLQQVCGLQKAPAGVALVSPGAIVPALWTRSFYEPVRQESVTFWAVKLLCFLSEDVAVLVDFQQKLSHELFVHRVFCAGVVAEGYSPSFEEV